MSSWDTDSMKIELDDPVRKLVEETPFKRSEDSKGHDMSIGTRVPKYMGRTVEKVREMGPYETNSDVYRDAFYLGIQVLELRYEQDNGWQADMMLWKMANDASWQSKIYEEEDRFVSSIENLYKNGDASYAAQMLQERITVMPKSQNPDRYNILLTKLKQARLEQLLEG